MNCEKCNSDDATCFLTVGFGEKLKENNLCDNCFFNVMSKSCESKECQEKE